MAIGDVLYFESDQAIGHAFRNKYHIELGTTDFFRAPDENVFLYISSINYDSCFPIALADYPFLERDSFISCGNLVYYPTAYIRSVRVVRVGAINAATLGALRQHLAAHDVMVSWEINLACRALDGL